MTTKDATQVARHSVPENDNTALGHSSVVIRGTVTENEPTIPHVTVNFLTAAAPSMLFSTVKEHPKTRKKNKTSFVNGADWFDTKLKLILNAIRDDDPWADQLLYDIEKRLAEIGTLYIEEKKSLKTRLDTRLGENFATLHLNDNMHMTTYKVTFQNRLAYDLLWAVKELDTALYFLYLCDKYAVIPAQEVTEKRNQLRKEYRWTLNLIKNWKNASVTREDIAHRTKRAVESFEINSDIKLTKEVLMLEVRAACAPNIRTRRDNELDEITKSKLEAIFS